MRSKGLMVAISLVVATVSGCTVGTGVRAEGRADRASDGPTPGSSAPMPAGEAPTIDAVRVLREDSKVSPRIKKVLKQPCGTGYADGWYPLYVKIVTIPGTNLHAALITVQGCVDVVACEGSVAAYAYRLDRDGGAEQIYAAEQHGSRIVLDGNMLTLRQPTFTDGPGGACPGGLRSTWLRWTGAKLVPEGG